VIVSGLSKKMKSLDNSGGFFCFKDLAVNAIALVGVRADSN
jgi:hypothetical protein